MVWVGSTDMPVPVGYVLVGAAWVLTFSRWRPSRGVCDGSIRGSRDVHYPK